jgi:hypothetical protein
VKEPTLKVQEMLRQGEGGLKRRRCRSTNASSLLEARIRQSDQGREEFLEYDG